MENRCNLDLDFIPKELKLLLEIMKAENEDVPFLLEKYKNIDWKLFLQLVMHHRVYPVIYSKLKNLNENVIPKSVIKTLYQEYKKNIFQMLGLCREMEQISELFTENSIDVLFLKGPVIAADIYDDISLRTSKDLDILIPINCLQKAEKLLLNCGFEKKVDPYILNEWKWKSHHIVYFHPQRNIQLEIHWRMQPRPWREPSFSELWERRRVSPITTYPVNLLGKEDLFLYLVSHGARHAWFRLRWLLDIDKLLGKGIDFEKTNLLLKKYNNIHIVGQALILASQLLGTPINDKMKTSKVKKSSKELAQMVLFFIKDMLPLETIMSTNDYERYKFSLKTSNLHKIYPILLLFYPTIADAETLRLPKSVHFLYFPFRPFLWAWRTATKHTKS
ncbi:nucleotidyltransferase domain-containing protein [Peribacillus frigoritolerans]|uniref:nucleotidyltransferase domain-containing protein n=1 Tax=Peribacillus frigoritolerans TaxID=450367 RepID=UPI003D054CA1